MNKYADYTPDELRSEIEAATFCRDMDLSLCNTYSAQLAQIAIDEMDTELAQRKEVIKGATAVNSKFSISLTKYDDDQTWISVTNHEGKTCKQPYTLITREELIDLRDKLNTILEVQA